MFGLEKGDSDFLVGMLIILAYVGAMMSFISLANISKFQLYIRTIGLIALTGVVLLVSAYLTAKGYL